MSTKVAIVCEDPTGDRYILEPVVRSCLKAIGVPSPRVSTVTNPRLTGFTTLLAQLCGIVARYHKTVSTIVIAFDLDGEDGEDGRPNRRQRVANALSSCETKAENVILLGTFMEAEVYAIWGARGAISTTWAEVRSERDPKERYFEDLLTEEDALTADGGRTRLMNSSLRAGWASIRGGCPELEEFEAELRTMLGR